MTAMQSSGTSYAVDIVFCIDVTGSMVATIDQVKEWAVGLRGVMEPALAAASKAVSQLRVRVVAFRDRSYDDNWLETSDFFELPRDDDKFASFVAGLHADGGGPQTESALEAFGEAINSDWERDFEKRRHIVVLFTDAPAYALGVSTPVTATNGAPMPQDMDELVTQWGFSVSQAVGNTDAVMEYEAKRLILFVPELEPWIDLRHSLENTLYRITNGEGCADVLPVVQEMIVGSV